MIFGKVLGSFLIIISTSLIGYAYGKSYSERLRNLVYLQQCIKLLETEVIFGATPLPDALMNVYKKGNKKVSFVFREIRSRLLSSKDKSVSESFLEITHILEEDLHLSNEDIQVFLSLGRTLGTSNREEHRKDFKMVISQLKSMENEAREEKDKNEKMYKSLGVLSGIAIVIMLL